ncbi:MAG: type IV secretion system protein TraC [Desulfobaccales bacterium]
MSLGIVIIALFLFLLTLVLFLAKIALTPMRLSAKRERISELFSVQSYDRETGIYHLSPPSLGFGFLCWPLSGGDQKVFDRLNGLLNLQWPTGSILQFNLWTSPDLATERLLVPNDTGISEVLRQLRQERAEFLRQAGNQPLDGGFPLRDIQLVITARLPLSQNIPQDSDKEQAVQMQRSCQEALATCGVVSQVLSADDYIRYMETLLNWKDNAWWRHEPYAEYNPKALICDQIVDYSTNLRINKDDVRLGSKVVKVLSPHFLPEETYCGIADHFLSDPLTGSRGIREPVLISAAVHFPGTEKHRGKLEKLRQWATKQVYGFLTKLNPKLEKKKTSYDVLFDEGLDRGDHLVQVRLTALLFCDEDRASSAVGALQSFWREVNLKMMEDEFICGPLFLNSLPFGSEPEVIKELHRYHTMASRQALPFLPLFADWKGTPTPIMQLVGRDGQLMGFDLFDSPSNYNAVIAAQSGSGKSFLTNEFITQYLSTGARVWVLDIGRSYEKLAESMDGTFMMFDSDSKICLNPFPLVANFSEEVDMLQGLIAAMAAPSAGLDDFQNPGVERVLTDLWEKHRQNLTFDHLAKAFKKEEDSRLKDLGEQLYPFTSRGAYGRFFNGPNTVDFKGDFIVLELEELRGRKHLQQVVLFLLIYQIQQSMFLGERARKKLAIVDEAWDLLTQGNTSKFIETGFRRFRKYNGAAIVVTQSINDLYASAGGEAIAANSAAKILLGQTEEAVSGLQDTKRLEIGEFGYELLKTLHTAPGRYSELFIKTDTGLGVGRLYVEPHKIMLYSTRPQDTQAIKDLQQNQGLSALEASIVLTAQPELNS